ncbi:MAG: choice-of-anchor D domain-containing protein, partial [Gammaproteobacteria bacterium]|nr:choice-of-anchor D domain-containing protein [Gammaproteobacteria bacterium]
MNTRSSPTANIVFTSDAFNETQTEVILKGRGTAPEVGFDKSQLPVDFGNVRFGQSITRTVVIENIGDEPLIVSGVVSAVTDSVPGVFSWEPPTEGAASQTVPAGESALLGLRFTPAGKADFDDQLMIDSDAVNMLVERLTVEGEGVASVMAIAITSTDAGNLSGSTASVVLHDFGDVAINDDRSRKVIISNKLGTASLTAGIPAITERFFQWKTPPPDTIVLAEHDSTSSLILVFEPEERGPRSATLVFPNDALNGTQTVILRGRGTGAEMELRVGGEILLPNTTHTVSGIRVGRSTDVLVEVHNIGNVPMEISEPAEVDRGEERFTLIANGGLPNVVTENQSVTFRYRFIPNKRATATTLVTFGSNAVSSGEQTIILHSRGVGPVISTEPGATPGVQFDKIRAGSSTDRKVVITNKGELPLMVTSAMVTNLQGVDEARLSVVEPTRFPQEVSIGATLTLTLRFMPEAPGNVTGDLVIADDAVNTRARPLTLDISGEGVASEMVVRINGGTVGESGEMSYNFGDVRVDASSEARVVIDNSGGGAFLEVQSPRLNSPALAANPHFDMDEKDVFPIVVQAGGVSRSSLTLLFEPQERGPQATTLVLASNALNGASQAITLKGRGVSSGMELRVGDRRLASGMAHIISATRVNASTTVA